MLNNSRTNEIFSTLFQGLTLISGVLGLYAFRVEGANLWTSFGPIAVFLPLSLLMNIRLSNFSAALTTLLAGFDPVTIIAGFAIMAFVGGAAIVTFMQIEKSDTVAESLIDYAISMILVLGGRHSHKVIPAKRRTRRTAEATGGNAT